MAYFANATIARAIYSVALRRKWFITTGTKIPLAKKNRTGEIVFYAQRINRGIFVRFVGNDALTISHDELNFLFFFFWGKDSAGGLLIFLLCMLGRLSRLLRSPGFVGLRGFLRSRFLRGRGQCLVAAARGAYRAGRAFPGGTGHIGAKITGNRAQGVSSK